MKRRSGRYIFNDQWNGSGFPPRSTPLPAKGIKARSSRGEKFVESWWADRWIAALTRLVDANRLQRGRRYARSGQVLSIEFEGTQVKARVQGSRPEPYIVSIRVAALSVEEWQKAIEAMASQAIFAAKLLAGEMPPDIESAFSSAGVKLYPATKTDLVTECSCPDYANPCKHVSAVYYLLGERFDADPFLLFSLRGKSKDEIISDLRATRGTLSGSTVDNQRPEPLRQADMEEPPVEAVSLENDINNFWESPQPAPVVSASFKAPPINAAVIKRLGEPEFWRSADDFVKLMSTSYGAASMIAISIAFSEVKPSSSSGESSSGKEDQG